MRKMIPKSKYCTHKPTLNVHCRVNIKCSLSLRSSAVASLMSHATHHLCSSNQTSAMDTLISPFTHTILDPTARKSQNSLFPWGQQVWI
ncbi:hypothetical protein FKM82_006914 [Ascaphus truei]